MSVEPEMLIKNISQLATMAGQPVRTGVQMDDAAVIEHAAVLIGDGKIVWAGPESELPPFADDIDVIDAGGLLVTPGLIDPHTHLAWAGSREKEFFMRAQGASYMEIHQAGGGINSTSKAVREASVEQLTGLMEGRLLKMAF